MTKPKHGDISRTNRIRVYIHDHWVELRWWHRGRRLISADLSEDEREARAIYLHRRYIAREGRGEAE